MLAVELEKMFGENGYAMLVNEGGMFPYCLRAFTWTDILQSLTESNLAVLLLRWESLRKVCKYSCGGQSL